MQLSKEYSLNINCNSNNNCNKKIITHNNNNNNKTINKFNNDINNKDSNNNKYLKKSNNDYKKFYSERVLHPCELTDEELEAFKISGDFYSYGAGIPSKDFFPIQELRFRFKNVDKEIELTPSELNYFQQYSSLPGLDSLVKYIRDIQKRYHHLGSYNDKNKEWDICLTTGAQHGLDCIFKSIFDRNDSLLVECYTYGGIFCLSKPSNVNTIPIEMDNRGIIPDKLKEVLRDWCNNNNSISNSNSSSSSGSNNNNNNNNNINQNDNSSSSSSSSSSSNQNNYNNMKFPKAIYIIPNQNPTGIIYDIERKKEIYEICREYDLLVIEDDPHFFLQFNKEIDPSTGGRKLERSFLSIDSDNRVIRVDTFSKFLSSGIRMGILTSNKILIDKLTNEVNASCFHPSGLTQITLLKLFESWGVAGFEGQVKQVQDQLIKRRDMMKQLIDKHLDGLVTYRVPDCGLYYWLKLNDIECSLQFFKNTLKDKKVYLGLGISHTPNRIKTPYVRITFSYMNYQETDIAFKILSQCLKQERIKSNQQI